MVLRKIAGMVVITFGIIIFLYGAYLFIDFYGGFAYLSGVWQKALVELGTLKDTEMFKQYLALCSSLLFVCFGLVLIYWGDRLMKK